MEYSFGIFSSQNLKHIIYILFTIYWFNALIIQFC